MIALTAYLHLCPRSPSLPLATAIEGPPPATAARVLVFLHGRGGSIAHSAKFVTRLRDAGLPSDTSIVLLEGPFPTPFGQAWGNDAAEQAVSRARVRARLTALLGAPLQSPSRFDGFRELRGKAAWALPRSRRLPLTPRCVPPPAFDDDLPIFEARTWLARAGRRRGGLVALAEVPRLQP